MWAQFDSEHYITIAVSGYEPPGVHFSNIAFFPLYPWLMRLLALPFGPVTTQSATITGFLISNVALLVALIYLVELVTRDFDLDTARRSVLYVLIFPTTLFLSAVYAEALFLATSLACMYHARRGEWYRAGLAGGLAALTRPFGLLLLVPLFIELVRERAPARAWPALLLIPAGLAVYFGYLWWEFGDPFAYLAAGDSWGRGLHAPWEALLGYLRGPLRLYDWTYSWIDLISMAAMIAILALGWRRVPRSYGAFALAGIVFALFSGYAWFSASRHALGLFPLIVMLAVITDRPRFRWAWIAVSAALAGALMWRFAVGDWVA